MHARTLPPIALQDAIELDRGYRSGTDPRLVRRCHAVLLAAEGRPVPEVAALLRVDQSTVHRWLDRFEAGGAAALAPGRSPGRPRNWDEAYALLLVETVRHGPRWYGLEHSVWTCPLLAGYLAERTGVELSAKRVGELLHLHGLRLKQPTLVPPRGRDPQYRPKARGRSSSAAPTSPPSPCSTSTRPTSP